MDPIHDILELRRGLEILLSEASQVFVIKAVHRSHFEKHYSSILELPIAVCIFSNYKRVLSLIEKIVKDPLN